MSELMHGLILEINNMILFNIQKNRVGARVGVMTWASAGEYILAYAKARTRIGTRVGIWARSWVMTWTRTK
jgi:hypothetical protein